MRCLDDAWQLYDGEFESLSLFSRRLTEEINFETTAGDVDVRIVIIMQNGVRNEA